MGRHGRRYRHGNHRRLILTFVIAMRSGLAFMQMKRTERE